MKYLFARNVMIQSLRLELTEAWKHEHSKLIEALHIFDIKCFTLIKSFLSLSERFLEKNNENRSHHIHDDVEHFFVQLSLSELIIENSSLRMTTRMNLRKLNSRHFFLQKIAKTYYKNYDKKMINFDNKSLKWYQRLTFTDEYFLFLFVFVCRLNKCFAIKLVVTFITLMITSILNKSKSAWLNFFLTIIEIEHTNS